MKTIELKWIEDDNHVVAADANTGLKDLIDAGVFKTLSTECKDDVLYITGEQDELDKAVMKIQKAYAKYGQIMIKEAKKEGGLRIESYDDNVQEIFDYTVNEFNKLKENKHSADYITKLGDLQIKFMKLKEAAGRKDKATIQNYLDEISTLTENAEIKRIKPIRMKIEESTDPDSGDTVDDVIEAMQTIGFGPAVSRALVKDNMSQVIRLLKNGNSALDTANVLKKQYLNEDANNELRMKLSNPANWGIIESESTVNESFLSPKELKKKLQRVALKWASEKGIKYEDAYNDLRKRKSVKDMLDFYTVDEIIDDLKKNKKEVDDKLEAEEEI